VAEKLVVNLSTNTVRRVALTARELAALESAALRRDEHRQQEANERQQRQDRLDAIRAARTVDQMAGLVAEFLTDYA
jgi:hypothetical protein